MNSNLVSSSTFSSRELGDWNEDAREKTSTLVQSARAFRSKCELLTPLSTRLDLLPKEILHPILDQAYHESTASASLPKRPGSPTPYEKLRRLSFAHRVLDTKILRSTCSAFHSWAVYRITHPPGKERIEIDFSDVERLAERLHCPGKRLLQRLLSDFPLLGQACLVLYLGDPGHLPNIRKVMKLLQSEPPYSKERKLVGGVSFWDSDTSYKAHAISSQKGLSKASLSVHRAVHLGEVLQTPGDKWTLNKPLTVSKIDHIFEASINMDLPPIYCPKVLRYLELHWVHERDEELAILAELYDIIAQCEGCSAYTEVPIAVLKSYCSGVYSSFATIVRTRKHVVLREFKGLDDGHMRDYIHQLFLLAELENISHHQKLQLQPIITGAMWELNRQLWPLERSVWLENLQNLCLPTKQEVTNNQKLEFRLKWPDEVQGRRVWRLFSDNMITTASCLLFANTSSLDISGGTADNLTLFALLTALSSSSSAESLQSLIYLPKAPATKQNISTSHHCPLFGNLKSLVNVHIGCSFCPEALEASRSASVAASTRKWRIELAGVMPCKVWQDRLQREKGVVSDRQTCTALGFLLEDCRSAIYSIEGQYSTILNKCGKYSSPTWQFELAVNLVRRRDWQCKVRFLVVFQPLTCPPRASPRLAENDNINWDSEDNVLNAWKAGKVWQSWPATHLLWVAEQQRTGWDRGQ